MTGRLMLLHTWTFLIALTLTSAICGWFVPAFYDWTGADQSRPSPLMWQVPLAITSGALLFSITLPWIPIKGWAKVEGSGQSQFKLRSVMLLMSGVAIAIAIGKWFPAVLAIFCLTLALLATIRAAILYPERRFAIVAMFACMILPFAWVLGYRELDNLLPSIVWMSVGLPGFFLSLLINSFIGTSPHESYWLAMLITATQIGIGLWVIRIGPKLAIAYILFMMFSSLMGSLVLNALVRA